jgi:8-oxo-dGTP pyrophosphatase MutT (NUDIX family)
MRRELLEEIGVTPQQWQLAGKFVSENPPGAFATFHVYQVDRSQGSPRLIGCEHTALRWFAAAEIDCETELAPPQLGEILAKLVSQQSRKE